MPRRQRRRRTSGAANTGRRSAARAAAEQLERRTLFDVTWLGGGGDWLDAAKWSGGDVPDGSDAVSIPAGSAVTIGRDSNGNPYSAAAGTLSLAAGSTLTLQALDYLTASDGATINGTFNAAGAVGCDAGSTIALAGTTTFTAGGTDGGLFVNTGTVAFNGGGMAGGTFTNDATATITGGMLFGVGSTYINAPGATTTLTDDSGFTPTTYNFYAVGNFVNEGTFIKSGGTGTSNFPDYSAITPAPTVPATGDFENFGGTIDINTGTFAVHGEAEFGTTRLNVAAGATFQTVQLASDSTSIGYSIYLSGPVTGAGGGTVDLTQGNLIPRIVDDTSTSATSTPTLNFPDGMLQVTGSGFEDYGTDGRIINVGFIDFAGTGADGQVSMVNQGTVRVTGTTDLPLLDFVNDPAGVLDLESDAGLTSVTINNAQNLLNEGTLIKSAGTGVTMISAVLNNQGGTIDIGSGTIDLPSAFADVDAAGPLEIAMGSALQIEGNLSLTGTLTATGGGIVDLLSGNLTTPVLANEPAGTLPGVLDFTPGTFIDTGGVLDGGITNAGTVDFQGDVRVNTITNQGMLTFDAGPVFLAGDLMNAAGGVIDFTADTTDGTVSQGGTLTNLGTIIKSGGTGTLTFTNTLGLVNQGTIEAASGTIQLPGGDQSIFNYDANGNREIAPGQTLKVDAGAAITLDTTDTTLVVAGTVILGGAGASFPELATVDAIDGTGNLSVLSGATFTTAGPLTNMGTLVVGGTVTVNGSFTESPDPTVATPPTLAFAVGAAPGTAGAPDLTVTGATTLAGDLTAAYAGGFGASAGTAYTAATFATAAAGAFASTAGVGPAFTVAVGPTTVVLNSTAQGSADLSVGSVSAPASVAPGASATVTWTVTNASATAAASGSWVDSVYLSPDGTINAADVLLGRVIHTGGLAVGASYVGTLLATFPAFTAGERVVVETDSGLAVPDLNRANNVAASAAVALAINTLPLGTSYSLDIADGTDQYYEIPVATAGVDVVLTAQFTAGFSADLFVKYGSLPSVSDSDESLLSSASTTGRLLVPADQAGDYYVLVHGREGAGAFNAFVFTSAVAAYGPSAVSPNTVGAGSDTLTISGSGFAAGSTAELVDAGGAVVATADTVTARDANTLLAHFDLSAVATGTYSLTVATGTESATLANAVAVGPATPLLGAVQFSLSGPPVVRFNHVYDLFVRYANPNDVDVPAPLFELSSSDTAFRLVGGYVGSSVLPSAAFSDGFIDLLGIDQSGEAGVLPAGYSGVFDVQIEPIQDLSHTTVDVQLSTPAATDTYDLSSLLQPGPAGESLLSAQILAAQVNGLTTVPASATAADLTVSLDALGGQLAAVASTLSGGGLYEADVADLLDTAEQSADGFGAVTQQQLSGAFGQGTPDPLTYEVLSNPSEGYVDVVSPAGTRRFVQSGTTFTADSPDETGVLASQADGTLRLTESDGSFYQFNSAATPKLAYYQDAAGVKTTFNYDANGNVTSVVDGFGNTTTYAYNAANVVTSSTDGFGNTTTYGYTTATGPVLTPGAAASTSSLLTTITTPAGTTTLTYTPAGGSPATASLVASVTLPDGSGVQYTYDGFGRVTRTALLDGSDPVTYAYDATGLTVTTGFADGTSSTSIDGPGGMPLSTTSDGQTTRFSYGPTGLLSSLLAPGGGGQLSLAYSATGEATGVTSANGTVQGFTYDADGRVTGLTDGNGNTTTAAYNADGQLASTTFADGTQTQYAYTSAGEVSQVTSRAGQVTGITYTTAGQVAGESFSDGTTETFTYDAHGNLVTATDAAGTTTFTYNAANDVTSIAYPGGRSVGYTYDADDRISQESDQTGVLSVNGYDADGRLSTVSDGSGNVLVAYTYDSVGRVSMEAFANGTKTVYGYDAQGLTASITNLSPANTVSSSLTYTYDPAGDPVTVTDQSGHVTTYTYDGAGQLTGVALPGGRTVTYAYDAAGNRTSVVDSGVTTTYAANDLDEYNSAGSTAYHYNANGDLTSTTTTAGTTTYTYDARGHLASSTGPAGTFTYAYDALGDLASYTTNGVQTTLLTDANGNVIAAYNAAGILLQSYTYGDGLVAQTAAGANLFYTFDLVGNTTSLTNSAGAVADTYAYLPFGEKLSTTGSAANPFTYSGSAGVLDLGDGFYQTQNRTYSPAAGRFIQPDPSGIAGGSTNLYAYVANSPTDSTDPTGLDLLSDAQAKLEAAQAALVALQQSPATPLAEELAAATAKVASANSLVNFLLKGVTPEVAPIVETAVGRFFRVTANQTAILAKGAVKATVVAGIAGTAFAVGSNVVGLSQPAGAVEGDRFDHYAYDPEYYHYLLRLEERRHITYLSSLLLDSHDPNEIVGPAGGGGAAQFVTGAQPLPYTIFFENQSTATAPAQDVVVTTVLDPSVDLATFQLTDIGFGSQVIAVPAGLTSYSTRVSYVEPDNGLSILVDVSASLDVATRTLTWTLDTLDPATLDAPANPLEGFLPPDDATGRGEGFVGYTVDAVAGLATGTAISALASIVFDTNAAISTATWTNTIDAVAPSSAVTALAATQASTHFALAWSGSDDANGSGIAAYTVYVSVDGGAYAPYLSDTTATSAEFTAAPGHTYAFYTVATDGAGNVQATPAAAQATTTVPAIARTVTVTAGHPARFTDAAGGVVTISLTGPGTGTLSFLTAGGKADPALFVLTGTTAATRVSVRAAGRAGTFTLTDVSATGSLAAFTAATADLVGTFAVTGTLASLSLDNAADATVTVGGAGVANTFRFGALRDVTLTTAAAVRSLAVGSWTDGPLADEAISAPSIGSLSVAGSFDADLTLTGTGLALGSANVRASVTGGTWAVAGSIGSVTVRGNDAALLTAAAARSLQVGGNLSAATVAFTNAKGIDLTTLNVTGTITGSAITAAASIGTATFGGMTGSTLFAGVAAGTTGLPTAVAELAAGVSIRSVNDRGRSPFAASDVAAYSLGTVTLSDVTTDDGGTLFGVAAHAISSFALDQPKARPVRYTAKQLAATLAALGGDLRVEHL